MVISKTRRLRTTMPRPTQRQDPMQVLQSLGLVTRNDHSLEATFETYFQQTLGASYRTRLKKTKTIELRERARKYLDPEEKLSDLVIQMREE